MEYFWATQETIPSGLGFSTYGTFHLLWLGCTALVVLILCLIYRRSDEAQRQTVRRILAALTIADELFKYTGLLIGGNFAANYLPLHLCSINIFLIAIHAWKPSKLLENFLYSFCIIPAAAALIFPATTTTLPPMNFMVIHSLSIHGLLLAYPIVLLSGGELRKDIRMFPKCLLLLLGFAAVATAANAVFGTNFMFLREATPSNPLYIFRQHLGNHLWGYPILLVPLFFGLYGRQLLRRRRKSKPISDILI